MLRNIEGGCQKSEFYYCDGAGGDGAEKCAGVKKANPSKGGDAKPQV